MKDWPVLLLITLVVPLAVFLVLGFFIHGVTVIHDPDPKDIYPDPKMVALIMAILNEDLPGIDRALAAGADINAVGHGLDRQGEKQSLTPLVWSHIRIKKKSFQHLLEHGADPNQSLADQMPLMIQATWDFDPFWLQRLLDHGGDPNFARDDGSALLVEAISMGQDNNFEMLIRAGADLNRQNRGGWSPLIHALNHHRFDLAYRLLQAGADFQHASGPPSKPTQLARTAIAAEVNRDGDQWQWREKVIDFLLEHGFDFQPGLEWVRAVTPEDAEAWQREMQERLANHPAAADQP